MKRTPLYDIHVAAGAKIVPFAGYEMPVSYTGIVGEHLNVRNAAGVFDVSHMGEFIVEGEKALELIQYITCNNVSQLFPGRIQYSALINENGGIIDDLLVNMLEENRYMLVVNASNIQKDFDWIAKQNENFGCKLTDISDEVALIAVQGPKAAEALQALTKVDLSEIAYYHFKLDTFARVDDVIISATGYTGAGGFEIYCNVNDAAHIWNSIMKAGEPFGIKPAGLGCRDTLRLEMGFCLYGNDINDETSPLEAGLGWITKLNKGDFIGKNILEAQKANGVEKKLVGLELAEKLIPRQHFEICDKDGNIAGEVTSGTMSPSLNKPVAMGYVKTELAKEGQEVFIKIRNKMAPAKVVKLPFLQN